MLMSFKQPHFAGVVLLGVSMLGSAGCGVVGSMKRIVEPAPPPPRVDALDPGRYTDGRTDAVEGLGESVTMHVGTQVIGSRDAANAAGAHADRSAQADDDASSADDTLSQQLVANPSEFLPAWWHDAPDRTKTSVSICAQSDANELVEARGLAIDRARQRLRALLGGAKLPDAPASKADSVRLPDGRYRAFVRLTARTN
jgi:hypothetical protein